MEWLEEMIAWHSVRLVFANVNRTTRVDLMGPTGHTRDKRATLRGKGVGQRKGDPLVGCLLRVGLSEGNAKGTRSAFFCRLLLLPQVDCEHPIC